MKTFILFLILLLISCDKEQYCSNANYSLVVWEVVESNNMIRVSYESDVFGYMLYTRCPPEGFIEVGTDPTRSWAEWSLTRRCSPMEIKIVSLDGRIEEVVKI